MLMTLLGRVTNASMTLTGAFVMTIAIIIALQFYMPDLLKSMLIAADYITDEVRRGSASTYSNWIDFLVAPQQLVFLFLTIVSRIVIAAVGTMMSSAFARDK